MLVPQEPKKGTHSRLTPLEEKHKTNQTISQEEGQLGQDHRGGLVGSTHLSRWDTLAQRGQMRAGVSNHTHLQGGLYPSINFCIIQLLN
jgi:hypothetical protein